MITIQTNTSGDWYRIIRNSDCEIISEGHSINKWTLIEVFNNLNLGNDVKDIEVNDEEFD